MTAAVDRGGGARQYPPGGGQDRAGGRRGPGRPPRPARQGYPAGRHRVERVVFDRRTDGGESACAPRPIRQAQGDRRDLRREGRQGPVARRHPKQKELLELTR